MSEVSEIYKKAKQVHKEFRFEGLREKALNSCELLVTGYDATSMETVSVPVLDEKDRVILDDQGQPKSRIVLIRRRTKHVPPSPAMVIFVLRNLMFGWREEEKPDPESKAASELIERLLGDGGTNGIKQETTKGQG